MKNLILVSIILLSMSYIPCARSITIQLNGIEYNVHTIETSYSASWADSSDLLKAQPWWGDEQLAKDAALQSGIYDDDGSMLKPNGGGINGPFFAFEENYGFADPRVDAVSFIIFPFPSGQTTTSHLPFTAFTYFAVVESNSVSTPDLASTFQLLCLAALTIPIAGIKSRP